MPGKIKSRSTKPAGDKNQSTKTAIRPRQTAHNGPTGLQALPQNTVDRAKNGNGYNLNPADILALQQTHGNQAVQRLLGNNGRNRRLNNGVANGGIHPTQPSSVMLKPSVAPVKQMVQQPLVQRGLFKKKDAQEVDNPRALNYFKKLKKPRIFFIGTSKAKRRKLAVSYYQKRMKEISDKEEKETDLEKKRRLETKRDSLDYDIRRAYRVVFKEELPFGQDKSLAQAHATTGNLEVGQPDCADPSLIGQEPDQYKITLVSSLEKIDWNKMFATLKYYYMFIGINAIRKLLSPDYKSSLEKAKANLKEAGHVWVRLSTYVKGKLRDLYSYGFYSRKYHDPFKGTVQGGFTSLGAPVPGHVHHPDTDHENDPKKGTKDYEIPPKKKRKYEKALAKAQAIYKNPPPYIATAYNCASFARDVVNEAGFSFPIMGIGPRYLTPGALIEKLKEVKKDDKDDLQNKIKGIGERVNKDKVLGARRLQLNYAKEKLIEDVVDKGLLSKEKAEKLSLVDIKVLLAFRTYKGRGAYLLGQLKQRVSRRIAFIKLQEDFQQATNEASAYFPGADRLATVPLSLLNTISTTGLITIPTFLGISRRQLNELKNEVGVRLGRWKVRDKERIGVGAGIEKGELRNLTTVDVKTFNRFKRMKLPAIKGKKIDPQEFIRRYKKAGYKAQDLAEISKLSEEGRQRIAPLFGLTKRDIDWLIHEVRIKAGLSNTGVFKIPGDKSNMVTVYNSATFKPLSTIFGGDRIDVLDSAHKSTEFIRIRFTNERFKEKIEGSIYGANIYKRPTRKRKKIEAIKQRRKRKKQSKPDKPFLSGDRLKGLHDLGYELEKYDPLHREADQLNHCYERWQTSEAYQKWQEERQGQMPPPAAFYDFVSDLEKKFDVRLMNMVKDRAMDKLFGGKHAPNSSKNAARWVEMRKAKNLPIIPRIKYLEAGSDARHGREQYRLVFDGNKVKFANNRPLTSDKHIYVMSAGNEFFAKKESPETQMTFHHSSFLQGEKVGAAGTIKNEGSGFLLDLESGHYHPSTQHIVNAMLGIQDKGVEMDSFRVKPFMKPAWSFNAGLFMKMIDLAKSGSEKLLDKLAKAGDKAMVKGFKKLGMVDDTTYRFKHFLKTAVRDQLKNLKL